MVGGGAETAEGVEVGAGAVAFVLGEAIAGELGVEGEAEAVAGYFGEDGGAGDEEAARVAFDEGVVGDGEALDGEAVDEGVVGEGGEGLDGAEACPTPQRTRGSWVRAS